MCKQWTGRHNADGKCASSLPMYAKEFPNLDPHVILTKMCLSSTQFDYEGISMGQFVNGIDAFIETTATNSWKWFGDSIRARRNQR